MVGIVHSKLLTIMGSTDDVSKGRTCSSNLDGVWAWSTPPRPQPRSLSATYCLGGRNGTGMHKEQILNHERQVQAKRETLLSRISKGEQAL